MNRSGASGRARLAFLLVPPGLARLEALDPLNRALFQVAVDGEEAVDTMRVGDLTVWVRSPDAGGWHFPTSTRRSGETILEVARRELWDAARIVAPGRSCCASSRIFFSIASRSSGVPSKSCHDSTSPRPAFAGPAASVERTRRTRPDRPSE